LRRLARGSYNPSARAQPPAAAAIASSATAQREPVATRGPIGPGHRRLREELLAKLRRNVRRHRRGDHGRWVHGRHGRLQKARHVRRRQRQMGICWRSMCDRADPCRDSRQPGFDRVPRVILGSEPCLAFLRHAAGESAAAQDAQEERQGVKLVQCGTRRAPRCSLFCPRRRSKITTVQDGLPCACASSLFARARHAGCSITASFSARTAYCSGGSRGHR
jgi:hypothetical protein